MSTAMYARRLENLQFYMLFILESRSYTLNQEVSSFIGPFTFQND
jgi:hypothetical protein